MIVKQISELTINQAERLIYFHFRVLPHLFHLYHESDVQQQAIIKAGYPGPSGTFEEQAELELSIYINGLLNTTLSKERKI